MDFHDRRPEVQPDQIAMRLASSKVSMRHRGGGEHEVYHQGERVGSVLDLGPGEGRWMASNEPTGTLTAARDATYHDTKAHAGRWVAAVADAKRYGGMSAVHHEFADNPKKFGM